MYIVHTLMGMCNVNALSVILCPTMIILMNCSPSFVCHQLPENFFNAQARNVHYPRSLVTKKMTSCHLDSFKNVATADVVEKVIVLHR